MELKAKVKIGEDGGIVIPEEMREALGVAPGDTLDMKYEDYELHLSTASGRMQRVGEYMPAVVNPPGE